MIEGTTTRSLSMALRSLYPGSFASYQGVIFRVIAPGNDILSGITPDNIKTEKVEDVFDEYPELFHKVYKIIRKQIQEDTGVLLPIPSKRPLRVMVPGKIDLRIDDTLEKVYCTNKNCGTIWKLSWLSKNSKGLPRCLLCSSRIQQAPIFVPVLNDEKISVGGTGVRMGSEVQQLPDRMMFCHYKTPTGKCRAPTSTDKQCVSKERFRDMLGSLVMRDAQRPIDSLKLCNPDCPKGLFVPDIGITRPPRQTNVWYSLDFPRESLNVPLSASAVRTEIDDEDPEIDEVNEVIGPLLGQFFNNKMVDFDSTKFTNMKILETVYGYRVGNQKTGSTTSYIGLDRKTVIGRVTNTKGFQITIKREIYDFIKKYKEEKNITNEDQEILEIILHSLKHALLVEVPVFTGLDENKFHGAYEINEDEDGWAARVYVYDTEDGGSGGFSTVMRNREILIQMLDDIRLKRIHCPVRECKQSCKHCLYIKNCGSVNRKLNRNLLIESEIFQLT